MVLSRIKMPEEYHMCFLCFKMPEEYHMCFLCFKTTILSNVFNTHIRSKIGPVSSSNQIKYSDVALFCGIHNNNLMNSIGADFLTTGCPSCQKPHAWDAVLNLAF